MEGWFSFSFDNWLKDGEYRRNKSADITAGVTFISSLTVEVYDNLMVGPVPINVGFDANARVSFDIRLG